MLAHCTSLKAVFGFALLLLVTSCITPTTINSASTDEELSPVIPTVHREESSGAAFDLPKSVVDQFEASLSLLRSRQYDQAENILLALTRAEPKLASPHINLGLLYVEKSLDAKALLAFERALELKPGDCVSRIHKGMIHRRQRDFMAAEKSYLNCIFYHPDYAFAHLNLGILYELYLGRLPAALSAYERYHLLSKDENVESWIADLSRRILIGQVVAETGYDR